MTRRHRVVWAEVAVGDLDPIVDYVVGRDVLAAARREHGRIQSAVRSLVMSPLRGRVVPELRAMGVERYREAIVPPYRIIFRVEPRDVFVVAVLDGRRDLEELLLQRAIENG